MEFSTSQAGEGIGVERALVLSGGGGRGAFQAGVLEYLTEKRWHPELICGTSVGAINAVAMGCGVTVQQLAGFWRTLDRQNVYSVGLAKFILSLLTRRFSPILDTTPLRRLLEKTLDMGMLQDSKTDIVISAVNMKTAQIAYFNQHEITLDHVMASSAMPLFFPWQIINGETYWDGGVMVNTPIAPALARNAKEIIVVLLSPVGSLRQKLPQDHRHAAELLFEHLLIGSCHTLQSHPAGHQRETSRIATVAPERMLGFRSLLNFSARQTDRLIDEGYLSARRQLRHFL